MIVRPILNAKERALSVSKTNVDATRRGTSRANQRVVSRTSERRGTSAVVSSSIDINRQSVYEGEQCEVNENCVANSVCTDKRCTCNQGFTAQNGLCCTFARVGRTAIGGECFVLVRSLNANCANNNECWSQLCSSAKCACPSGYEPREDNTGCRT